MAQLTFKINFGSGYADVDPPINHSQTRVQRVWHNGMPSATLQAISYEWVGETAQKLNAYKVAGLNGGPGITEGPGLQIFIGSFKFFDGCIDTANKGALWECDRVKAPIIESGRIDWLKGIFGTVSFAHLKRIGMITTADYKKVPYTRTEIPDGPQLTMLILQEVVMVHQLLKEVTDITSHSVQAGGSATDMAFPWPGSSAGSLAADLINTIAEIIYTGILLISIITNSQLIFDQIVQKKKYKYAMLVRDLLSKACQFSTSRGYPLTFSSTIFQQGNYKDLTIMPAKRIIPKKGQSVLTLFKRDANEVNSSSAYGHPDMSVKELIDALGVPFNTSPVIYKGKLHLEEKNSYGGNSTYVLPDTGPEGYTFNYPDPHGTNAAELASCYLLEWLTDQSDLNTIHQYEGTTYQVTMLPNVVINEKNLLLSGLQRKKLSFAHAKRKEYLTGLENFLQVLMNVINGTMNALISVINGILNVINTIIGWFGGSTTTIPNISYLPTNVMNGRIGWLELTQDVTDIPKLFLGVDVGGDWQIHPNNATLMAAKTLVDTFHPEEIATRKGQRKVYGNQKDTVKIKYCLEEDQKLADNSEFTTVDGKKGKFDSVLWAPETDIADAVFRIRENFTNNLIETVSEDGE